jgi:hypothetical protein
MMANQNKEFIYALTHWLNGEKIYFYVGRTERELGIRFKEHQYDAQHKHTDVYTYIREFVLCQIFEEEVLCYCRDDEPDDCEFFWVVQLIRAGYKLQNEKHGDAKRIAAETCANTSYPIHKISDVKKYKEYVKSEALRAKILAETTETESKLPPNVAAFIKEHSTQAIAARKQQAERRTKLDAAKVRREEEYQLWLNEQRNLFEDARQRGDDSVV